MKQDDGDYLEFSGEQVDAVSSDLIQEFYEHLQEFMEAHPDEDASPEHIFQGWIIQKVAGLQLCILQLSESINRLAGKDKPQKGPKKKPKEDKDCPFQVLNHILTHN